MKQFFKTLGWIVAGLLTVLLIVFILLLFGEWRPLKEEVIFAKEEMEDSGLSSNTFTILTWNTGYAGLSYDMDFFMDGGEQTRTSKNRMTMNLLRIRQVLTEINADIILLQEVDIKSRRSYKINQMEFYREILTNYTGFFAYNYASRYVPVPLKSPLGEVRSGVAIFTKKLPEEVIRYQYPGGPPFPRRRFDLKRCLLAARYLTPNGHDIWIGTTHNSAYDKNGTGRSEEMQWLRTWLESRYGEDEARSVLGGDWNQNPPGYTPSPEEIDDPYFSPTPIAADFFGEGWNVHYDPEIPTARYLYEPLTENTTTTTIDFFLSSPGINCLEVKTIDLGFENSDHNPVLATFAFDDDNP